MSMLCFFFPCADSRLSSGWRFCASTHMCIFFFSWEWSMTLRTSISIFSRYAKYTTEFEEVSFFLFLLVYFIFPLDFGIAFPPEVMISLSWFGEQSYWLALWFLRWSKFLFLVVYQWSGLFGSFGSRFGMVRLGCSLLLLEEGKLL